MRSTNGQAFGTTTHFRATSNYVAGQMRVGSLSASGASLTNPFIRGLSFDSSFYDGWLQQQNDGTLQLSLDGNRLTNLNSASLAGTIPDARLPVSMYTNIAELSLRGLTNRIAYVKGYWGSNEWGAGFLWHSPSAAVTNFGTIFTNSGGGNWHRFLESSNYLYAAHFGIPPMNTDDIATRFDAYQRLTNCFAVAGNWSTVEFPPYGMMVTADPGPTNALGRTFKGSGSGHGSQLAYPNRSSWIAYQGAGGAGSKLFSLPNSLKCIIEGIGFETSTPVYTGLGVYPTNNAEIALDFDQTSPHVQICSDNIIRNCLFRSRGTNVLWTGLSIARISADNCENFLMEDLAFVGNGNVDLTATGNSGQCILIGSSANSRQHILRKINMVSHQYGMVVSNGGFNFDGGNGDGASFDFKLVTWAATSSINDWFSENNRQCFWIGNGSAGLPMTISDYRSSHSASVSNLALIELHGAPNLDIRHSGFYNASFPNQVVFVRDAGFSPSLKSSFNRYGINYTSADIRLGLTNFSGGWISEFDDINDGLPTSYQGSSYKFQVYDNSTAFKTNRTIFDIASAGAAIRLSPFGHRVHVGAPPASLNNHDFVVHSGSTNSPNIAFGDATLPERYKFVSGVNVGDTFFDVFATNNRSANLRLFQVGSNPTEIDLVAGNNRVDLRFISASGMDIRQGADNGATPHVSFEIDGTSAFHPTNVGVGVKVNGWLAASNLSSFLLMPTNGILWQGGAQLTNIYTQTATLDFGNVATIGCADLTMNVPGAALGDVVDLGVPNASVVANSSYSAWVSSTDTVTVRFCALISGDPASGVFRAEVHKWK